MGLGARLNFAFLTVILVMVGLHAGAQFIGERNAGLAAARKVVEPAISQFSSETQSIQKKNADLAGKLSTDAAFRAAFAAKDRSATAEAIRSFADRTGMPGFVTVIDRQGKVFYSSDSPAKFGYAVRDMGGGVLQALFESSRIWYGPAALTATGTYSIVGIVPIKPGGSIDGLVAVCQPINTEFLTGLQKKVQIMQGTEKLDFVLFSVNEGRVIAFTPTLSGKDQGFITSLNRQGKGAISGASMEKAGRLWLSYRIETAGRQIVIVLTSTPLPDMKAQIAAIAGQAAISGFAALILSLILAGGLSGRVNRSISLLSRRARDLAAQKKDIPGIEDLSGEFIELAEVIDAAVASPRSSVKSLQSQMSRHNEEIQEKQKQVEQANNQVEAVNRQLMIQSKQLSEISKQINHANSQSILLQQKLASVLQISTEGFLILDAYGNILSTNPTFVNWSGCAEAELAGKFCFDFVRKPGELASGNGQHDPFSRQMANPGDLIAQFFPEGIVYNIRQEKKVEVLVHLQPIMMDDQTIQGYVMVLRDKSLHSEATRLRTEIVAMLQDSIRAPLAVADSKWSNVLTATSGQYANTSLAPALIDLHSNYQAVLGVIDSLLMMHGGIMPAQTTTTQKDHVSITRLIGDCLEQVAQQARAHQIMLDYKTVTGLPTTATDKQILRDIVIQLLEKMISVTAPGGRVRVESTAANNEIRLSIFSSGPALAATEIEDMFVGFIQGKHSEDTYSSRLSLYLVRNNLERLGGKIWAESDRGTYFRLTLPVQS